MKMDEHARAWSHETVARLLTESAVGADRRNSLHWEIVSHLHEAAEARARRDAADVVRLAHVRATWDELGGDAGVAAAFLQARVAGAERASFWKRAGAYIIDFYAVFAVVGLSFFIFDQVTFGAVHSGPFSGAPQLLFLAVLYFYFVGSELQWGTTLGKMAFKLRTVGVEGRRLTNEEALVRNIAKAFPPLLLVDALFALQPDRQRVSDRLAGTMVIDTSKPAAASAAPPPSTAPQPGERAAGGRPTSEWAAIEDGDEQLSKG